MNINCGISGLLYALCGGGETFLWKGKMYQPSETTQNMGMSVVIPAEIDL